MGWQAMILILILITLILMAPLIYIYLRQEQAKLIPRNTEDYRWDEVFIRNIKGQAGRQKITLYVMLVFTLICSLWVRALAIGWAFLFLGPLLVFAPLLMHLTTHIAAILFTRRSRTVLFILISLSHIFLFLFLLTQSDGFDGAGYSGLTILLSRINIELSHTDALKWDNFSYMLVLPLMASWGLVQLPWLYEKMMKPKEKILDNPFMFECYNSLNVQP
jgi:hypothetical protein